MVSESVCACGCRGSRVIILYFALRTDAYLGLGTGVIQASFKETVGPQMFLLKMLFTALTLCASRIQGWGDRTVTVYRGDTWFFYVYDPCSTDRYLCGMWNG